MDNTITTIGQASAALPGRLAKPRIIPTEMRLQRRDSVAFGEDVKVSTEQAMSIVQERAMAKLRAVVDDARAALGLPEDAVLDTSPEATADRIATFALGAFGTWQKQHTDVEGEEARQLFADFIGGAIQQGIDEARGILDALGALTPGVQDLIGATSDIIWQRLDDFVANG